MLTTARGTEMRYMIVKLMKMIEEDTVSPRFE